MLTLLPGGGTLRNVAIWATLVAQIATKQESPSPREGGWRCIPSGRGWVPSGLVPRIYWNHPTELICLYLNQFPEFDVQKWLVSSSSTHLFVVA